MVDFDEDKQNLQLAELRQKEEEEFMQSAATSRGLQYFNLSGVPIETDALGIIPEPQAREAQAAAFQLVDKRVGVGVLDPDNAKTKAVVETLSSKGYTVTLFLISRRSLEHAFSHYAEISRVKEMKGGSFDISSDEIQKMLGDLHTVLDIKKHIESILAAKEGFQTTRIVEVLLAGALGVNASDLHVEPEEKQVRLRYRLDGVLNDVLDISYDVYNYILSRIKLISGLKLNLHTTAQDGRFSIHTNDTEIEIRTSILPGAYGESIVLRVLNPEAIAVSMEELGLEKHLQEVLAREITKPNGMILNTGPTGSGKTTTLYAFLKKVHEPGIKIITIEDPVEYHLKGIVQTQTNPDKGYTFSSGLRAALRQDPDIIMVGEIRDEETAEIAINAAATGHLVFSTLHTNDAAGTFPRLLSLGVNPKVISSSVTVAMAQRLARKLCTYCKKESALAGNDKVIVEKILLEITVPEYQGLTLKNVFSPVGCKLCNMTGYKGRIGIFEAILMDQKIEAAIIQNPSEREIAQAARGQGLLTMSQDGVVKLLGGVTSIEELRRVIDIDAAV
ncbi:MAG TPA: GspE/PulE family protein [Candidatus Paceibacterota bacterium]